METIYLAGEIKNWIDTNLNWADSTLKTILWLIPIATGIGMLAYTRGNVSRTIKWVVVAIIFSALVTNIETMSDMLGDEIN